MFQLQELIAEDIFSIDDLELNEHFIVIIGQSGSGKSTLLRLLNNLDNPASGKILYNEKEIRDFHPQELRKKIVMLAQSSVIFTGTIRENLLIGLKFSKSKLIEDEQLSEMLHSMSIEKSLDTDASELSGGEQQRLALARILLMKEAEVFLLDEPTSDLDDKTTEHVMKQLVKITKNNGQMVIIVTHSQKLAKKYADKVINMDEYSMNVESS